MKRRKWFAILGGILFLLVFVLYMVGFFDTKTSPGKVEIPYSLPEKIEKKQTIQWESKVQYHEAIGTVTSRKRVVVSSQARGVVESVYCKEGEAVGKRRLFDLPVSEEDSLNQSILPGSLIANPAIKDFSKNAMITGRLRGEKWAVFDEENDALYSIIKENGKLVVYAEKMLAKIVDEEFRVKLEQSRKGVEMAESGRQQAIQMYNAAQANYNRIQHQYASAQASVSQAEQQLKSAEAAFEQANLEYNRTRKFREQNVATQQQLEQSESRYKQALAAREQAKLGVQSAQSQLEGINEVRKSAQAGVEQARLAIDGAKSNLEQAYQYVKEAKIALSYTRIFAPDDAVVAEKQVEPGDLAWPGKPLFVLHRPQELQLEAKVPESLRNRIVPGQNFRVAVESMNYKAEGKVSEIVPSVDPMSRTFLVKLSLPFHEGMYPGMFGKLFIDLLPEKTILVPLRSLRRVGQFEMVYVEEQPGRWARRFITTGKRHEEKIEVLSGLDPGESIALFE